MHDNRLTFSSTFFDRHIEDGYVERGAVERWYSGVMQSWFNGSAVLKRVNLARYDSREVE